MQQKIRSRAKPLNGTQQIPSSREEKVRNPSRNSSWNPFMIKGLPLIPDHVLVESKAEYRQILSELKGSRSAASRSTALVCEQLEEVLGAMEKELHVRGIGRGSSGFGRSLLRASRNSRSGNLGSLCGEP